MFGVHSFYYNNPAAKYNNNASDVNLQQAPQQDQAADNSPRQFLLKHVQNRKLMNMVRFLYKRGARIGDGGTADAVRYELDTGELYSPAGHFQKAVDASIGLTRLIESGILNNSDLKIAMTLRQDLTNALEPLNLNQAQFATMRC